MLFTMLNNPQEETKDSIRRKRKRGPDTDRPTEAVAKADASTIPRKKQVAFAK